MNSDKPVISKYYTFEIEGGDASSDDMPGLALKGGTAINLTVFDLPRLSVDIDLDYCGDESREVMLRRRNEITGNLMTAIC